MAITNLPIGANLDRLTAILSQSKIQSTNPALYQVITQLIKQTQQQININHSNTTTIDNTITSGGAGINQLTGDVTAGPGTGSQAATISVAPISWTPALKFGGGSTGLTYSTQSGSYILLGSLVIVFGRLTLTALGSSTGSATITGLPFTVATQAGTFQIPYIVNTTSLLSTTSGKANIGATTIDLMNVFGSPIDDTNFNNNTDLLFSGMFLK
jgi:hypothetical protein